MHFYNEKDLEIEDSGGKKKISHNKESFTVYICLRKMTA